MAKQMGLQTVFVNDRAKSRELRKAKLVVLEGEDKGKSFEISKAKVYAGRSSVNDIVLSDASISGTHFEIRAEEEGFLLRDLGSTNGTRVGGCLLREVYLAPNATFRAGNSTIKLVPSDEVVEIPLHDEEHFHGVIGRSVAMREVFALLQKVASSELTVLIEGETGTGKERVARAIHDASRRKKKPYVVLDCSSIPRDLMESYVFGHEKGAFTGAVSQHQGAFEQAAGGTLFLDEIGELPLELQPRLLRVLENREFKRVGGAKTIRSDCRVIAATNRELRAEVADGNFREDLYFRLTVIQLHLPALKDRPEDIPLLVESFLDAVAERRPDRPRMRLTADALDVLMSYPWPGNVRELKNVIERAASLSSGTSIDRSDLHLRGSILGPPPGPGAALGLHAPAAGPQLAGGDGAGPRMPPIDLSVDFKDAKQEVIDLFEQAYLARLMEAHEGNISQASRDTGLTRYHLRELLKKHDLK